MSSNECLDSIRHAIEHAKHYLPTQGPIEVFIHHNTLHAFEHLRFDDAVIEGLRTYGSQPYWQESRYREEMSRGRIQSQDLQAVLSRDLGKSGLQEIALGTTRHELHYSMLRHPVLTGSDSEIQWLFAQSDALEHFQAGVDPKTGFAMLEATRHWIMRDLRLHLSDASPAIPDAIRSVFTQFPMRTIESWNDSKWQQLTLHLLWRICQNGVRHTQRLHQSKPSMCRHRDILLKRTHFDCDLQVHDLLIRLTSAFLDQGFAGWSIPQRKEGVYRCFLTLFAENSLWTEKWLWPLKSMIEMELRSALTPIESIANSLLQLGVQPVAIDEYIQKTLLALPGWTGMVEQMSCNASWMLYPSPKDSLEEFLAVRLLLDRLSSTYCLQEYLPHCSESLSEVLSLNNTESGNSVGQSVYQMAFDVYQIAQRLGWSPSTLQKWLPSEWQSVVTEIGVFDDLERRRLFHLAYEYRYRSQLLDAISEHSKLPLKVPTAVSFQVITCIDDREESFRRHLEELDSSVETYGAAGFFNVPMYFRGAADAHFIPLCPIIMVPKNYVEEVGPLSAHQAENRRAQTRMLLGKASQTFHMSSRSLFSGVLTALFGSLNAFPLVARVLFPRLTSKIRGNIVKFVRPSVATQLRLERGDDAEVTDKGAEGFTLVEMANMIERLTGDLGIQGHFAPLVIVFGHGSSSLNNPHESAYNCGACGGGKGGPNARAVAQIANDPRVRAILKERGLIIPDTTLFVGGFHNTCDDSIQYSDVDRIPPKHTAKFLAACDVIENARRRNAHERARRFYSLDMTSSDQEALRHVERRSEDLAQVRPEYNHATNAACFVGRRGRTRGLFMDRRCFLTSYDPTTDDESTSILMRILQAVIPVCGGISLEYYFSTVDNVGYGCGTKLPHNITSLIGVMEGATSDLRTGLSQQMVEIHEPVRILFIVEAKPEAILSIMDRNSLIRTYIRNYWVQMATLDPVSNRIQLFQGDRFEPYEPGSHVLPEVSSSLDWYRGWREPLGFSRVVANTDVTQCNTPVGVGV
ncbi:MAG: DUF2309 domain-containing protein [Pirellula sp.]